jgi:hypothetical protein
MARRPKQLPPRDPIPSARIETAIYVGSPEHKQYRWWGGLPAAYAGPGGMATRPKKQTITICPLITEVDRAVATGWVRQALRNGQFRYYEADPVFPNHIWYRHDDGQVWFGRCINTVQGHYKGWPIGEDERSAIFG